MKKVIRPVLTVAILLGLFAFGRQSQGVVPKTVEAETRTIAKTQYIGTIEKIDKSGKDIRIAVDLKHAGLFKFPNNLADGLPITDKDADGVIDALDAHPDQAGPLSNAVIDVPYKGKIYVFRLNIQNDYLDVFRYRLPHVLHESGDNVASFVVKQDPYLRELVDQAKLYAAQDKEVDARELLLALVKNTTYNSDAYTGKLEYPKYPIETLADKSGDCEDLAILAANLIGELNGYDSAAFVFFPEHMGLGLKTTAEEVKNRQNNQWHASQVGPGKEKYLYQEVTDPAWQLGQMPREYAGKLAVIYTIK